MRKLKTDFSIHVIDFQCLTIHEGSTSTFLEMWQVFQNLGQKLHVKKLEGKTFKIT